MILTFKFRLRDKHAAELNRQARVVNTLWNYCNETSRKAWDRDHKWLSAFDLINLTSGSSKALDIHSQTISLVCEMFEQSKRKAKVAGLRWRTRKSLGWVPFSSYSMRFDGAAFIFRKVRYELMHMRGIPTGAKIRAGSFNQDSRGRWYINVPIEIEFDAKPQMSQVGVDLGLKDLASMSDGSKIETPAFYRKSEVALGYAQRARKSKRAKAIQRKVANRRKDFLHKASTALVKRNGLIVVGDVSVTKLAQTNMAKSVFDAAWSDFKRMISYKALMHGGMMVEVDERYSTQTCSHCGAMPEGRPRGIAGLGIREWTCCECGTVHDRDMNAAKNILRVGLDTLVEGAITVMEQPRRQMDLK